MIGYPETRRYSKKDDLSEIDKWSNIFPWYARLVQSVKETLRQRDRKSGDYSLVGGDDVIARTEELNL